MRVNGSIAFSGVLRNQGEVVGAISAADDPGATLVVGKSGKVIGTVGVGHVVVGGRIEGNIDAEASVEVQDGACIVGDISYGALAVDAGGHIEGVLKPRPATDTAAARPASSVVTGPIAQPESRRVDGAGASVVARKIGWRPVVMLFAIVAVLVSLALANRGSSDGGHAGADTVVSSVPEVPPQFAEAKPASSPVAESLSPPAAIGPSPVPALKAASGVPAKPDPAPAPEATPEPTGDIVVIRGDSPGKPADFVFVICSDACSLARKKRDTAGDGSYIEIAKGATKRVPISRNEVLRVARGQDIDIFYQGRKVSSRTVQSGAWMTFEPYGGE